jgi:hypothetical protein
MSATATPRLWEIAENYDRADLTGPERADHCFSLKRLVFWLSRRLRDRINAPPHCKLLAQTDRNHKAQIQTDAPESPGCVALIRLTITPAAYAVVAATHPASARLKRSSAPNGEFYVWLEPKYVDELRAMRKQGESYSDVILRMAEASEGGE